LKYGNAGLERIQWKKERVVVLQQCRLHWMDERKGCGFTAMQFAH